MGAGISDLEVNEMIAEVDEEHTGRIQYADFVKYVTP
jgi:Ca2+-binding EF-hand superfamily protein